MSDRPRIYLGIKYHPDHANRQLIEAISTAFAGVGLGTVCVVRDVERWGEVGLHPDELMRRSFELIESSQVVVIELTEKGVGIGIEAGYAHAMGIPVVVFHQPHAHVSETLRGIARSVIAYAPGDLISAAEEVRALTGE